MNTIFAIFGLVVIGGYLTVDSLANKENKELN